MNTYPELKANEVSLIVTCYNQVQTVNIILDALLRSTALPGEVLVINNGSDDGTQQLVADHPIKDLTSLRHEYRAKTYPYSKITQQGFCDVIPARNLAYALASKETLICIDGDCIPAPNLVESYVDIYNRIPNITCAFVGMRLDISPREISFDGVQRYIDAVSSLMDYRSELYGLFSEDCEFEKLDFTALTVHSSFWSCNYSVRKGSCRNVHNLLRQLKSGNVAPNEIFDTDFDGTWGNDDPFFGACLHYSGTAILTNRRAVVYHIDHPSRHNHRNDALFFQKLDQLRRIAGKRIQWESTK